MIEYRQNKRLHYIGGPQAQQHIPAAASADWWDIAGETCVAAYQAKGAASEAASYVNLANPGTYDLTVGGGTPTWASETGWGFLSTDLEWLDTGLTQGGGDWSFAVRYSNANSSYMFGAYNSVGQMTGMRPNFDFSVWANASYFGTHASAEPSGVVAIADRAIYRDGASIQTISAITSPPTATLAIGRMNNFSDYFTGNIQAVAIYSTTLDAAQVATLSSAMAAL